MNHSIAKSQALLREHHDRVQEGPVILYPPKTEDAPLYWVHTGVCPSCSRRSITVGRCITCGWEPIEA